MKIVHEQRCFPRSTGLPLKIHKPHVMQETKLVASRAPLEVMEIYALLKFFWAFKARGGGPGSKKQVWLISKSNLSWSYYFLQNRKIFVYDENMARQSSGVLLSPIQNIGVKMTKNGHFRSIFSKVLVS